MATTPIRYRFAMLLLASAMALVANPLLHACSHDHSDELDKVNERVADMQWTEQELCPYCDAVSQYVKPAVISALIGPVVALREVAPFVGRYPDLRARLSTRLRAPPFIA